MGNGKTADILDILPEGNRKSTFCELLQSVRTKQSTRKPGTLSYVKSSNAQNNLSQVSAKQICMDSSNPA